MVRKIKDKNIAKNKKLLAKAQKQENRNKTTLNITKPKKRFTFDKVMLIITIFSALILALILFTNNYLNKHKVVVTKQTPITTPTKIESTKNIDTINTNIKTIKVDKNGIIKNTTEKIQK